MAPDAFAGSLRAMAWIGVGGRQGQGFAGIVGLALVAACFVDPGPPPAADSDGTTTGDGSTSAAATTIMLPTTSSGGETSGGSGSECPDGCGLGETCVDGVCVPASCAPEAVARTFAAPAVVFSVDKSRSMSLNTWDDDGDANTPEVTRWTTIREALIAAAMTWGEVEFGLKLFPDLGVPSTYTADACAISAAVNAPVGPNGAAALNMILPATDDGVGGGTPAKAGIEVAVAHLQGVGEAAPRRPRFVIVVIDGAANCRADAVDDLERFETYDAGVLDAAAAGLMSGSPVAVIGVDISAELTPAMTDGQPDGVNVSALLDDLALAGGLARGGAERYYNTHDAATVKSSLAELIGGMVCTVVVDPPHPSSVLSGLLAGGEAAPMLDPTACGLENGWYDAGGGRLRLCGALCELYRAGGELSLQFECGM